jgi:hypothetical protein
MLTPRNRLPSASASMAGVLKDPFLYLAVRVVNDRGSLARLRSDHFRRCPTAAALSGVLSGQVLPKLFTVPASRTFTDPVKLTSQTVHSDPFAKKRDEVASISPVIRICVVEPETLCWNRLLSMLFYHNSHPLNDLGAVPKLRGFYRTSTASVQAIECPDGNQRRQCRTERIAWT